MSEDKEIAGSSNKDDKLEEDDTVLDMWEVLKTQEQEQEDVMAVLGAGDDKNCTYSEGYVTRQALYSCLTCTPEAKYDLTKAAGICLACSYHCHDEHELIELYTKRTFRCDCGNSKFNDFSCNLDSDKSEINEFNVYNQNFSGFYCTCKRPFPDEEDDINDEMNQCIVCEDWYHSRHLDAPVAKDYAELICGACIKRNDFLLYYDGLALTTVVTEESNENIKIIDELIKSDDSVQIIESKPGDDAVIIIDDIDEVDPLKMVDELINADGPVALMEPTSINDELVDGIIADLDGNTVNTKICDGKIEEILELSNPDCTRPKIKSTNACSKFMEEVNWRTKLCTCKECIKMYNELRVSFLIDMEDPVQSYVEKGRVKTKEKQEKAMEEEEKFMKSLDRVTLLEMLASYNEFKEELAEYLKKFADNKKVIRVEDVQEFFTQMKSRKRQKTEMSYYCR